MKKNLLFIVAILAASVCCFSQNVFNTSDAIVRYNSAAAPGTSTNPNPNKAGLQKWVTVAVNGVSKGVDMWDASSFKSYFINIGGNKMAFRLKFPYSYNRPEGAGRKYPMMMFLHGAGEVGCSTNGGVYNNEKPLWLGGNLFKQRVDANQFDGFLIYPQLVATSGCWGAWGSAASGNFTALLAIVDSLVKYVRADNDRLLVDGLSGGGYGAWRMAALYPQRVAKIMPSSAAGNTADRALFVHIPIWFATGGKDPDPSPAQAQYSLNRMKEIGADCRYTIYPDLGHQVWETFWREPDFISSMNNVHKANPLVFFQRTDYCPSEAINSKLGITAGFYAYEWQKDNITIATRTGTTTSIINNASIISFTGNEITVKSFGTYRVRFKRVLNSAWSEFSRNPAVIRVKAGGQAPAITVAPKRSIVLPATDGSTTAPLQMPAGFATYQWVRVSDNVTVSTTATYNAPAGVYKAKYSESGGCGPTFSPNFTVVNANGTPKPDPATNLAITVLTTTSVKLTWGQGNNETGFEVYRSTVPGGPYTFLALTAANIATYTDATLATNTTYYYVVRAVNGTGAAVKSNEASPNGGNKAPVIAALSDMFVKTGSTAVRDFTVTDAASDIVTVTITNKPAFITLSHLSGFNYRITATATVDNVGYNNLTIVAADNKGMSATQSINVLVSDKNTKSVFVNFGSAGKTAALPWNNWLGALTANATISNLKDETNVATTIDVVSVTAWSTTTVLGHISGNNSGVFPDAVLQSGIADNGTARTFKITGLNTAKRYNIVFVGSQNEGIVATTQYATGAQSSVLDARYNTQKTANLNSLVPDGTGSILVTATRTGTSPYSYLNGMVIEEYDPSITLLNPDNLYVEPVDRSTVTLTWSDKTNNESATSGYELQRATNATFSTGLVSIPLAGNITSYKNTGLIANTKYYYRVRAKNGAAASAFSNSVITIT
ncbi:MAG: fibronectin type III domain-containing protein, partial [Flavitalea sp.]